jgi:hypothetical protein
MSDPIQAEWSSLGAVWQSRAAEIYVTSSELAGIALRQERERRRMRVLVAVAWVAAFGTAAWLTAGTPFKGLGILLVASLSAGFAVAASLAQPEEQAGSDSLMPSLERAIGRQESLLRAVWAGAAVGMVALAAELSAASHLLLLSSARHSAAGVWIALGVAAVYSLACSVFCGLQGWRGRAELVRLQELHAHLSQPRKAG